MIEQGWDKGLSENPKLGFYTMMREIEEYERTETDEEKKQDLVLVLRMMGMGLTARGMEEEDIGEEEIIRLQSIMAVSEHPWVVGRLGDVIWRRSRALKLKGGRETARQAERAVRAFMMVKDAAEHPNATKGWERAGQISRELDATGLGEEIKLEMLAELRNALEQTRNLWWAGREEALRRCQTTKQERAEIAELLLEKGRELESQGDYHYAKHAREGAIWWARKTEDRRLEGKAEIEWAKGQIAYTEKRSEVAGGWPNIFLAEEYRKASERLKGGAGKTNNKRAKRLHQELEQKIRKLSSDSYKGMEAVPFEMDLREMKKDAMNLVRGKSSFADALWQIALGMTPMGKEHYKSLADGRIPSILEVIGTKIHVDPKGQRVYPERDERTLTDREGEEFDLLHFIHVEGVFLTQLAVIREEHGQVPVEWYVGLCEKAAWIPPKREKLWAEGLKAGMDYDWTKSMHYLLPQIEEALRYQTERADIAAFGRRDGTVEQERVLGRLMALDISERIISEEWRTNLEHTVTSPTGWNLRNRHAHGLMDQQEYRDSRCVFVWWLMLHMVVSSIHEPDLPLKSFRSNPISE